MPSIFKRKRDKHKKGAPYWIQYFDRHGKRRTKKGLTDKAETQRLAARIEERERKCRLGLINPEEEELGRNQKRSITQHLADFVESLTARDRSEKYVKQTARRIETLLEAGKIRTLTDLTAESVEKAVTTLQELHGFGVKTVNHYVSATKTFANWLVPKRLAQNPLLELKLRNTAIDIRHKRRALSQDEFGKLVNSARNSDRMIQCYDGPTRARIYLISYLTGLRRKEIASLTPESFRLKKTPPTLVIEATDSKHRKRDELPLHDDLVAMLKGWLADLAPDEPLFPKLANRRTWLMVKLDLEAVGIPYRTRDGVADFHAVGRHTYITELLKNGTSLPEARQLARHSDVKMTMQYTHIGLEDQARAVQNLPTDPEWLHIGCTSGVSEGHSQSTEDTGCHSEAAGSGDTSPCEMSPSVTHRQKKAPPVTGDALMEAAGIEPASCDPSEKASTCVFR